MIQYILPLECPFSSRIFKPCLVSTPDGGQFWGSYLSQTKVPPALVAICCPLDVKRSQKNQGKLNLQ